MKTTCGPMFLGRECDQAAVLLPSTLGLLEHAEAGRRGWGDARSHPLPPPGDSDCSKRDLKPEPACKTRIHVSWAPTVCLSHPSTLLFSTSPLKTRSTGLLRIGPSQRDTGLRPWDPVKREGHPEVFGDTDGQDVPVATWLGIWPWAGL